MEKPNRRGRDYGKLTRLKATSVPGLAKPDENAYLTNIEEEKKCIKEIREKLDQVFEKLKIANDQKDKNYSEFVLRRDNVSSIQSRVNNLMRERATIHETLEAKQREKKQNELSARKAVRPRSSSDIDLEIAEIEKQMMITTMSLKEEKQLMVKIEALKGMKTRSSTKPTTLKTTAVDTEGMQISQVKENLEKIEAELATLRATRSKEYSQMQPLSSREIDQQAMTELYEQRKTLKQEMKKHIQKKEELFDEWTALVKTYNNAAHQEQKRRNEKLREERAKKNAEIQRLTLQQKLEEAEELPVTNEFLLLEQLVKYVQKLIDEKNNRENLNGHVKTDEKGTLTVEAKDEESEGVNKKLSTLPSKKGVSTKKEKAKVLRYDLPTLMYFEKCGVVAPLKEEQLEECLAELQKKLAYQKELQLAKIEEMDEQKKVLRAQLSALDNPPPTTTVAKEVVNPTESTASES